MEVFVVDEQHDATLDMARWQKLATDVLIAERVTGQSELTVIFVDEATMAELNAQFMGKQGPTDVLAFPIDAIEASRTPGPGALSFGPTKKPVDVHDHPLLLGDVEIGQVVEDEPARPAAGVRVVEANEDGLALASDAGVTDALVAQLSADVPGVRVQSLRQRAAHVDLEEEVDAAAQVQAEVHGQRTDGAEPGRRARHEVERHGVRRVGLIGIELAVDDVARLELGVRVGEADPDGVRIELGAGVIDLRAT